jgi:VanZ family protein
MIKRLCFWLPALVMMSIIFLVSSTPSSDIPNFDWADTLVKKGGHMLGYALLALAYWNGLRTARIGGNFDLSEAGWRATVKRPVLLSSWTLAVLYAVTDEFHQSFVAGRHSSPLDVLIDASGAAIGLLLLRWFRNRKQKSG